MPWTNSITRILIYFSNNLCITVHAWEADQSLQFHQSKYRFLSYQHFCQCEGRRLCFSLCLSFTMNNCIFINVVEEGDRHQIFPAPTPFAVEPRDVLVTEKSENCFLFFFPFLYFLNQYGNLLVLHYHLVKAVSQKPSPFPK